ncbi:MAG: autotransporter-associated beta strand repeat-containing protein, partial [Verrucomicrobia bacterium]|nr:autotransporter-associated beta strand repeat-containing protein [Verrucomicrobiota bacterium]
MNRRSSPLLCQLRRQSRWMTCFLTVLMALWQIGQPLQAANVNWTAGSSTNLNWAVGNNWDLGLPTAADDVFLGSPIPNPASLPTPGTLTLGAGSVANSLWLRGNYTLTGGDLNVGTGIIRASQGQSATISSTLLGSAGINKQGGGLVTLSGTNTGLSGVVNVNSGTLDVTTAAALGSGALTLSGGALRLSNDSPLTIANAMTVTGNSQIISNRATLGAGLTHTLGTLAIGPQQLRVLAGPSVNSGTAGAAFLNTTLSANGTSFDVGTGANLSLGVIAGNFNFFKTGAGTLTLGGTSTRSAGAAYIMGGTALQTNVAGFGTSATTLSLLGGATLDLATDASTSAYPVTALGNATVLSNRATLGAGVTQTLGTLTSVGGNTLTFGKGNNVTSGTATTATGAATTVGATTFSTATADSTVTLASLNNSGFTTTFAGVGNARITGAVSGAGGVIKNDAGTLTLSSANTQGGAVQVNAGTLTLGNAAAFGAAATAAPVFAAGSILNTNGVTATVLSITAPSGVILQNNSGTAGGLSIAPGGTATTTIGATIQNGPVGIMALTINGTGAVTLNGTNTFTGATTLNQGRLNVNSAAALGGAGGALVLNAGILDNTSGSAVAVANNKSVTPGGNFTFGGTNSLDFGTGTATTTGSRVITLDGTTGSNLRFGIYNSNAANLTTTVNSLPGSNSTLTFGAFNAQGSGTVGTTLINGNGNLTITGPISSTTVGAGLNFAGSGVTTLTGASTYTGATTFSSGIVELDARTTIAGLNSGNLPTFGAGTLIYRGNTVSGGSTQTLGNVTLAAGGSSLQVVGGSAGATTLNLGTLSGGALATTTQSALNIRVSGTGPSVTTTSLASGLTNGLMGARGSITFTDASGATRFATLTTSNAATPFNQISGLTIATSLPASGSVAATNYILNNAGVLVSASQTINALQLNNTSTLQTLTINNSQFLTINSGGLLYTGTGGFLVAGPGSLRSNATTATDLIIHNFGTGGLEIGAVIANGTATATPLTLNGPGVTTLSGVNTYTGTTLASGGSTVSIATNSALGAPTTGAALTLNNATLRATSNVSLENSTTTNFRAITLGSGNGTFDVTGANALTVRGVISGAGSLIKAGTGNLLLLGANTYTGGFTRIQDGSLQLGTTGSLPSTTLVALGNATTSGKLVLGDSSAVKNQTVAGLTTSGTGLANSVVGANAANSTLTYSGTPSIPTTFAGILGGAGPNENNLALSVNTGILTLNGANTFLGGTTVSGGVLNVNSASALGAGTVTLTGGTIDNTSAGALTLAGNNAVAFNGSFTFGATQSLSIGSGTATMAASRTLTLLGDAANTNSLTFANLNVTVAAQTLTVNRAQGSGAALNIGTLNLNTGVAGGATVVSGNGLVNVTNLTATAAATPFTYGGTGIMTINGAATYGGLTSINGAGTLRLGAGGSLPSASAFTQTTGIFDLNGQNQTVSGAFTLTGPGVVTNASGTASTITATNIAASSGHLAGNLSGNFTLTGGATAMNGTYTNTGNLTFTNAGTGAFTVSGNVLNVGNTNFNANNTQAFTVSAPLLNSTGIITNSGTGTGITTISGNLGANVTGLVQSSGTSRLTLTGNNSAFNGAVSVTAGTL